MDANDAIMTTLGDTVFVKQMAIGDGHVMDDDGKDMGVVTNIVFIDLRDQRTIISLQCDDFMRLVDMTAQHLFDSLTLEGRKALGAKFLTMAMTKCLEEELNQAMGGDNA